MKKLNKIQAIEQANRIVKMIRGVGVSYAKRYSEKTKKGTWKCKLYHCSIRVKRILEDKGILKHLDNHNIKYEVLDGSHIQGFCPTGFVFWIPMRDRFKK